MRTSDLSWVTGIGGTRAAFIDPCFPSLTLRTLLRTMKLWENDMDSITASVARANLYRLIDEAAESHEPVTITGKRASAVLVSAEDWSAIQETLYLLAIPGMRESIKDAMAEPLSKNKRTLKW